MKMPFALFHTSTNYGYTSNSNSLGPLQNLTLTDQQVSVRFPNVMSDMNMISETANALVWLAQQLEA